MSETTPETSELRDRLATAIREADPLASDNLHADWAVLTLAADLLPVVAQEIAVAEQRALEDAAHEIEHSVMPSHPNAGYRDGHAHAAWVVRSLINRAAALAEPVPQEGKDGLRARIEALCVDLERSSHGGNWIRGDERRGCVAEVRAALAERAAEEPA